MKELDNSEKVILSFFDFTGHWSQPYVDAGYCVIQMDRQLDGIDLSKVHGHEIAAYIICELANRNPWDAYGILAAIPCTDFAVSGARWFAEKDRNGDTEKSIQLARRVFEIIKYFENFGDFDSEEIRESYPDAGLEFWVAENPVSRLPRLVPEYSFYGPWYFQPTDFGDPYTKKTGLYGTFNRPRITQPALNLFGSLMHSIPPGPERANIRSATPMGFSQAFFLANQ